LNKETKWAAAKKLTLDVKLAYLCYHFNENANKCSGSKYSNYVL